MPKPRVAYTADHVNRAKSMVRRHLKLPHEIVCITDNPSGIDSDIRIVPLWDDFKDLKSCFIRLKAFSPSMKELIGPRFVSIDLDVVVVGDLDPLFNRPEDFVIWSNVDGHTPYCGSMFLMTAGSRSRVFTQFDPARSLERIRARRFVGSDQAWISEVLGPGEAQWTKKDGVLSFRRHFAPMSHLPSRAERLGLNRGEPPVEARMIFFHGVEDPSQPNVQLRHPWVVKHWR